MHARVFQKTFAMTDDYRTGDHAPSPLGSIQLMATHR